MENVDKSFFAKTFKDEESKGRDCMYPWCQEKAINSHVFQQSGILSDMSLNRHLIVSATPDIWKMDFNSLKTDISSHIKKWWIREVYCFPWFCNKHDSQVFSPIEENIKDVNFSEYWNQLLFSYRGLCNELHRKIVTLGVFDKTFNYLLDNEYFDRAENIFIYREWTIAGIDSLQKFKLKMEDNLFGSSTALNFRFSFFEFPRFDVWISATLSVLPKFYTDADGVREYKNWLQLPNQFINIFPLNDKSIVIIGEQADLHSDFFDYLVDKFWKCSSSEEYKEILSDLITARLEFWCMNPSLFSTLSKEKLNGYIDFFTKNVNSHVFDLHSWINIFS